MFKRNSAQYLISQIPRFTLTLANINQLGYYDEILDVRGKDDFFLDHISRPQVKTKHLTCLTKSEDEVIQTLALKDAVESIETKSKYVRLHVQRYIQHQFNDNCHLKKPPNTLIHTYRPLIVCADGTEMSSIGLCMVQLGFYPHILLGGYLSYKSIVTEYFMEYLDQFIEKSIVLTGPKTKGKWQMINILSELGEQVLNLESLSEQFSYSQDYFETVLFNKFFSYDLNQNLWVVFEPGEIADMDLPLSLENIVIKSMRIHIEESLERRIRFILQDLSWICMDRISTLLIIEDIDIYLKNLEKEDRTLQHMKEIFLKLHRSRVSLDGFIFLLPSPPNGECWDILTRGEI